MKLFFHCCCGPCMAACMEGFSDCEIQPRLFWYNPNIHPVTEYKSRMDSLIHFAKKQKLELELIDEYGLRPFLRGLYVNADNAFGTEASASLEAGVNAGVRCSYCYRIRLEKTAAFAAENGFDAFSTSLLVSPYQNHEAIRNIGETLAAQYNIAFFYRDFRPYFREGQQRARGMGLYMQKYCGCVFSEEERYVKTSAVRNGTLEDAKKREPVLL